MHTYSACAPSLLPGTAITASPQPELAHGAANGHHVAGEFAAKHRLPWCTQAEGETTDRTKAVRHGQAANAPVCGRHRGRADANEHVAWAGRGSSAASMVTTSGGP
jgi:hypothetical protein